MFQFTKKTFISVCSITALAIVIAGGVYLSGSLQKPEWMTYDWRVKHFRSDRVLPDNIAVVLIDEASLKAMDPVLGRWPWPRSIYGDILDFLALGEPTAVVFDFLFTEKEQDTRSLQAGIGENDARFAEATAHNGVVYHAMQFFRQEDTGSNIDPLPEEFGRFEFPLSGDIATARFTGRNNNYNIPFAELYHAAKNLGIVNVEPDADGVYRRVPVFMNYRGRSFPSLSIAPVLDALKIENADFDGQYLHMGDKTVPVGRDGTYSVNLYGRYNEYSVAGLISSKQMRDRGEIENMLIDPLEFKDKIVFIGTSATGLQDLKNTAMDSRLPGVLIHASVAANILTRDFIKPPAVKHTLGAIAVLALLTGLAVFSSRQIIVQATLPVLLGVAYWYWALLQYSNNTVIEVVPAVFSITVAWALSFAFLVFTEGKEKKKVRMMLSQYVSPAVLKTVVDKYEDYIKSEVGVTERVTILFSDIRGFTTLAETLDAQKIVHILNYYFTEMTEAIFSYDGTIDKFIGDAIMAFWGAPVKTEDHAQKCVLAALEMNHRLHKVNEWLATQGYGAIRTGIGINTGEVVIGNIGSEKKLDYTVIGDNVNLASRLEGLTKEYDVPVIISQSTYDSISRQIPCRVVDLVRVKGKTVPIKVYAPVLHHPHKGQPFDTDQLVQGTEQAFTRYLKRDWPGAIRAYSMLPDDSLRKTFISRCQDYLENEPPADWDGAYTMHTK